MAITRVSQSSVKEGLEKYTSFYGGLSGALFGQYESIATVTVGSGGASSIEFTSIPGTYQHLQIRGIAQIGSNDRGIGVQLNGDTASNYRVHELVGNGSSASAGASNAATEMFFAYNYAASGYSSSYFVGFQIDILDYASTSKTTTARALCGVDYNGSGRIEVRSGLWTSTSAVTSVKLFPFSSGSIVQHSTAALYGIKAP